MRILLTGGTGLIGQALCRHWQRQGHELWVWSRNPQQVPALCSGAQGIARLEALDGRPPVDAVVNLAGAPIASHRWTAARRDLLWRSRVDLTRTLVDWMGRQTTVPPVLISGSAVGWYGDGGEQWLSEDSMPGRTDFGSRLCMAWEQEAERACQWGARVVLLRTAPVLAPHAGVLARLLPPFRLGLGGTLGNGRQWMPWIHIDDQVALIDFLLQHNDASGPYNACAPTPVRNREFARRLGRALHRPALLPVPALLLKAGLGELSTLLLGGQRARPVRLLEAGFAFRFNDLQSALDDLSSRL